MQITLYQPQYHQFLMRDKITGMNYNTFVKELRVNQNARHNYNTVFLISLPGKGCEIRFENVYLD